MLLFVFVFVNCCVYLLFFVVVSFLTLFVSILSFLMKQQEVDQEEEVEEEKDEEKQKEKEDESNYDDDEYEDDDERYSEDDDMADMMVEHAAVERGGPLVAALSANENVLAQRPRSTQSDPAKRRRSKKKGFIVAKPKRSLGGEREGIEFREMRQEEEERRVQRRALILPSAPGTLGPLQRATRRETQQAPRVPEGSLRAGTPLAMLSLAQNAASLGLFQARR
jgi:hypothetical protein